MDLKSENPRIDLLKYQLARSFERSHWHAVKRAVRDLGEEEARWIPGPYAGFPFMSGNILDILFHLGGDKLFHVNHWFGDGSVTWEGLRERFQADEGNLQAALKLLEEGYAAVTGALNGLTDADLLAKRKRGKSHHERHLDFFAEMLEHDLYHAGQIVYIRCLYEGRKPGGGG